MFAWVRYQYNIGTCVVNYKIREINQHQNIPDKQNAVKWYMAKAPIDLSKKSLKIEQSNESRESIDHISGVKRFQTQEKQSRVQKSQYVTRARSEAMRMRILKSIPTSILPNSNWCNSLRCGEKIILKSISAPISANSGRCIAGKRMKFRGGCSREEVWASLPPQFVTVCSSAVPLQRKLFHQCVSKGI